MMHTGLITAGVDMHPITVNGVIADQVTASASNMINRAQENLPQMQEKPQGILHNLYLHCDYRVIFLYYT